MERGKPDYPDFAPDFPTKSIRFRPGDAPVTDTFATTQSRVGDRRLTANRENAKKSTGPNTEDGKNRSRFNALKHGLTGAGIVLPAEMQAEVKRRAEQWNSSFKPINGWELWLLEFVAMTSLRIDVCSQKLNARQALLAERADSMLWDEDRNALAEEFGARLASRPSWTVQNLRRGGHGVHWLMSRWEILRDALAAWGTLNEEQCRLAFNLRGLPIEARDRSDVQRPFQSRGVESTDRRRDCQSPSLDRRRHLHARRRGTRGDQARLGGRRVQGRSATAAVRERSREFVEVDDASIQGGSSHLRGDGSETAPNRRQRFCRRSLPRHMSMDLFWSRCRAMQSLSTPRRSSRRSHARSSLRSRPSRRQNPKDFSPSWRGRRAMRCAPRWIC